DHEFPENHVRDCISAIQEEPDTIWTIGEFLSTDSSRTLPAPIPGQLHPRGYSYPPEDVNNYYGIACGATIYPRTVVDNRLFNLESYRFGKLYLEYGVRLYKKGYKIKPLNTTYIIHHKDENTDSWESDEAIKGAEILSMLMFSFQHMKSIKNYTLTALEIVKGILTGRYSKNLLLNAYRQYKKEISNL
ncbi:MAG: hypothetical protein WKF91_23190, partial [Segetibacter sp.]